MRMGAILAVAACVACDPPGRQEPLALTDPQTIGILAAYSEAEQLEAAPAQSAAYSPSVVLIATVFIDDEEAALVHLQQLGITSVTTLVAEREKLDGRAEQIAMSLLVGRALDDHFLVREAAAHAARIMFIRDQVATRCQSATTCDRARAYILTEQQHLQRLAHF